MQKFIGFDDGAMAYNRQYEIIEGSPGLISVRDAVVSSVQPTQDGNPLEELAGGVFGPDHAIVPECLIERSDGRHGLKPVQTDPGTPVARTLARAVYGGVAFNHFGHFLLEATTRLWALAPDDDTPVLFLNDGAPQLKSYQSGFLELLGLPADRIVVVNDRVLVENLTVPAPAFVYHHTVHTAYRDTFRRANVAATASRGRVFLSRSQTKIATTVGEHELEDVLRQDGWEIVIPEALPPRAQAELFRSDNVLLGLQGSAMHLGLFAPPSRRVVHLCRGMAYRGYYVLDDLMQAEATYFQAMSSPALPSKPITGPFLLDLDATLRFLRDEGLLAQAGVSTGLPAARRAELDRDYEAWWHYTESQIRFHRQLDHDGAHVDPREALEPALTATRLRPDNVEILSHATALTLKFLGNEQAAALLDEREHLLASGTRQAAHLLHFRAIIDDSRGRYEAALTWAEAASAIVPDEPSYANQRATALYRLGRTAQAQAQLDALVAGGTAIAANHYLLSILHEESGDLDAALASIARAGDLDRTDEAICHRHCDLLRRAGRDADALAREMAFLDFNQGGLEMLLRTAERLQARGEDAAALGLLRRACRVAPDDDAVAERLRQALAAMRAIPLLTLLGVTPSVAVREQSVMIYRRGIALGEAGRHDEALRIAVAAATMWPDNETIMLAVLKAMIQTERPADARLLVNDLLRAGRHEAAYYYVLSLAEGDLQRPAAARTAAARAADLAPQNALITEHYARLAA